MDGSANKLPHKLYEIFWTMLLFVCKMSLIFRAIP
jgi:hypothetical protein